jgi:ribosome modulation factor
MTNYTPGSAYNDGYRARMNGMSRDSFNNENPVYIQEWLVGWEDAHQKVINEARKTVGCEKPNCCKKKNFIQD